MEHRILIAGYYGWRNAGDEAILGGMLADLRQACPGAAFTVASGDPDATRKLHGVETVAWSDLEALIEAVRQASLVIVGGGGLFHDYWGVDPAAVLTERQAGIGQYAAPIVLAQMMGKPSLLYAVGVGPLRTPEGRALTRDVFAAADAVTVRDAGSRAVLADVGCDAARVEIVPDPAFHLPRGDDVAVEGALRNLPRPVLGVALRPWAFGVDPEAWQGEVAAALDAHLGLSGGTALFVPLQDGEHEVEDDVAVSRAVMARMACGGRAALAPSQLDPLQRFRLLGRCDRVLAMRLHGVVAALRGGAPVVALAYDPKVEPLMDAAGLAAASLPPEAWRRERIVDALARGGESPRASPVAAGRGAEIVLDLLRRGPVPAPRREAAVRGLALEKVAEVLRLEWEVAAQAAEIARLDRVNAAQAAELRKLEEGRARHSSKIEHLQRTADQLTAERNRLEFDYQSLNRSLGVNLVRHYWRALSSLAPEGSRRRAWYRIAHRSMRSALKLASRPLGLSRVVDLWGRIEGGSRTASGDLPADGVGGVVGASSHLAGFYSGRESSHLGVSKAVIFSATQLMENEGQRPTNLALEFARAGIPVVYCYWRWDKSPWTMQERLNEGIFQFPMDLAVERPHEVFPLSSAKPAIVMFEFPHPDLFRVAAAAHAAGWVTIYDAIDDWEGFQKVGQAPWYDREFEQHLATTSDLVLAVNRGLADRMKALGRRDVDIVPNGVPAGIMKVRAPRTLERGEVTVGYFGYLSSAWFDWDLVLKAARARPGWKWYIIGYGADRSLRELPGNLTLLGKVKQRDLAGFAANWDVGVVPFKPGQLAEGTDAIKVYEYLAMGLPVVVAGAPLPAMPVGLALEATDATDFLRKIEGAAATGAALREARQAFAASCSWAIRSGQILQLVEHEVQRVGEKLALFAAEE